MASYFALPGFGGVLVFYEPRADRATTPYRPVPSKILRELAWTPKVDSGRGPEREDMSWVLGLHLSYVD